jgi:hypothetical protein
LLDAANTHLTLPDTIDCFEAAEAEHTDGEAARSDRWLNEATYKITVNSGMACWKRNYLRMTELYDDIIGLDSQRRTRTKEILLSFIPRRRKIFLRSLELIGPARVELEKGRLPRDTHEQEIERSLQQLSRVKLSMKPNRSSIMNRSRTFESDIGSPIDIQPLSNRNLFDSHRILEIKAVEFQSRDRSVFQVGLAVATTDDFLHILGGDVDSDTILNAASFYGDTKQAEIQLKDAYSGCLPTFSFYLPDSIYSLADDNSRIEITTKKHQLMGADERVSLRLFSPRETSQWWRERLESWAKESPEHDSMKQGSLRQIHSSFKR